MYSDDMSYLAFCEVCNKPIENVYQSVKFEDCLGGFILIQVAGPGQTLPLHIFKSGSPSRGLEGSLTF